jgi:hypothetical protein
MGAMYRPEVMARKVLLLPATAGSDEAIRFPQVLSASQSTRLLI